MTAVPPIVATLDDLPPAVAGALVEALPGRRGVAPAAGLPFSYLAWGTAEDPPLLLVHGVTSNAEIWWRIGPALAAAGRWVIAIDMPGHGETGHWNGHHRFADAAGDVAAFTDALGLTGGLDRLAVVGHSWGAGTVSYLPAVGLRPGRLILLDPVVMPLDVMVLMSEESTERTYPTMAEARAAIRAVNPSWNEGDIEAKARSLTQVDETAALAILRDNGDWDGGLAGLTDPAARGIPTWVVRGDPRAGGLMPNVAVPAFAARIGEDHVLTIAGGSHSPQRTHPEALLVALLRALG